MIGNVIYLLFSMFLNDDLCGYVELETPHATFDGAYEHLQAIKKRFESKHFEVLEVPDGPLYVHGPNGFKRMYFVVTRTIEK